MDTNTRVGGRYQLVRDIGAGKFGRVYQALDTETGTSVAAKVLTGDDMEVLVRFYQEAAFLSTLKHPNIVQVFGTFLEQDSSWIIMELLEGRSLRDVIAHEHLSLVRVRHLMTQVAAALAYAHERNIVHRDIKPDNIMVVADDQVKVTDFGLARVLRPGSTLATMTSAGLTLHGFLYVAPEQIEGIPLDARADVYSVGAVMYHLVTGRPPFEAPDVLAVAFKIVNTPVTPPSAINPHVPRDWDALILKALSKDPRERFQSATALGEAISMLSPHTSGMDGEVSPTTTPSADATAGMATPRPSDATSSMRVQADMTASVPTAATWWEQGRAQERTGDLTGALESYRTGLGIAPPGEMQHDLQLSVVRVLRIRGKTKESAGDVQGALDEYRLALAAAPSAELPADLIEDIHRLGTGELTVARSPARQGPPTLTTPQVQPVRRVPAPVNRRWLVLGIVGLAIVAAVALAVVFGRPGGGLSTPDRNATAQAQARVSATAAARSNAVAQATAVAALRSTGEVFGPASGSLNAVNPQAYAGVNLRDFVARVRFVNPAVLPRPADLPSGRWEYGFWLRNFPEAGQYRLLLSSTKQFELVRHNMTAVRMLGVVSRGSVPNLNTAPGGSNDVALYVRDKLAILAVNGQVVSGLNLSGYRASGDVAVTADVPWSLTDSKYTRPLQYQNFAVWSLSRGQVGPKKGFLGATPQFSGLWTRNIIASVRFHNPTGRSTAWDYGLAFRNTKQNGQYRLFVRSDRQYYLYLHKMSGNTVSQTVAHGTVPSLNVSSGSSNDLTLFVDNNTAAFVVNGRMAATLDVSGLLGGDVAPAYGIGPDAFANRAPIAFDRFVAWPLIDTGTQGGVPTSGETSAAVTPSPIDNIPCQAHTKKFHTFVHLSILDGGKAIHIPAYTGEPPGANCVYGVHTNAPNDWIHVSGHHPFTPKLGAFFDIWGQPLSGTQVASATVGAGRSLKVYVNGKPYSGDPRAIPMTKLAQITIEVGPPFQAPRTYTPPSAPKKK